MLHGRGVGERLRPVPVAENRVGKVANIGMIGFPQMWKRTRSMFSTSVETRGIAGWVWVAYRWGVAAATGGRAGATHLGVLQLRGCPRGLRRRGDSAGSDIVRGAEVRDGAYRIHNEMSDDRDRSCNPLSWLSRSARSGGLGSRRYVRSVRRATRRRPEIARSHEGLPPTNSPSPSHGGNHYKVAGDVARPSLSKSPHRTSLKWPTFPHL